MRALLIVDLQDDYFDGGKMPLPGIAPAAANAARLLEHCRSNGLPRFHVQHLSVRPGAPFFVPGTPGVEINAAVAPEPGEPLVQKNFPNAFRATGLEKALRDAGVDELVVCGAMSNLCIDATTRAAADMGFGVTVAHDACAGRSLAFEGTEVAAPQVHAAFMAALSGSYAKLQPTQAIMEQWR
jgi:nicotinamidase-related amidase